MVLIKEREHPKFINSLTLQHHMHLRTLSRLHLSIPQCWLIRRRNQIQEELQFHPRERSKEAKRLSADKIAYYVVHFCYQRLNIYTGLKIKIGFSPGSQVKPKAKHIFKDQEEKRKYQFSFLGLRKLFGGLPWWRSGWESACQCRPHGFEPWSWKIPHAAGRLGP